MKIKYDTVENFIGWELCEGYVSSLIAKNRIKSVLEIGAGANPTLKPEFVENNNLTYTISDIDDYELKKADSIYTKLVIDMSTKDISLPARYDLIFSRMVGEHISNGKNFYQNIYNNLNKGGISFHCFSTLYAFPFVVNYLLPEFITDLLLEKISPRDKYQHGKFPAHYKWCRGPSKKMISNILDIGYEIIEYTGYFGHNYYKKILLLDRLEKIKSKILLKYPVPQLTAYASILLNKSS